MTDVIHSTPCSLKNSVDPNFYETTTCDGVCYTRTKPGFVYNDLQRLKKFLGFYDIPAKIASSFQSIFLIVKGKTPSEVAELAKLQPTFTSDQPE